jgi:hypothetical protein
MEDRQLQAHLNKRNKRRSFQDALISFHLSSFVTHIYMADGPPSNEGSRRFLWELVESVTDQFHWIQVYTQWSVLFMTSKNIVEDEAALMGHSISSRTW